MQKPASFFDPWRKPISQLSPAQVMGALEFSARFAAVCAVLSFLASATLKHLGAF